MESCEIELFGGHYDGRLVVVPKPPPPEYYAYVEPQPPLFAEDPTTAIATLQKLVYKRRSNNPYKYDLQK